RRRLEDFAGNAGHYALRLDDPRGAVAEPDVDAARLGMFAHAPLERLDNAGARTPGDVEARHRIAVAVRVRTAALGPADDREPSHAQRMEPRAHLAGGEVDIGLGNLARPVVFQPVELSRAQPVLPGQLPAVPDPHPALLGAVHEE